ncbi:phage holin family protein [Blastococcus haudaquaticus]|uniref:Holin-X, holin superfamily III n=1 Tax=Blastococcus haudaquaticus TaxID=1938745 RepID=A0A286H5A6_9ACTN|nr:phage holin family protein [Blastococcus haudaquaticus]SOE02872.1 Putative Holin-X, holin superfamily III [Blastococcus haudaquaticus]
MTAPSHEPDTRGATRVQVTPDPANASTGELIGQLTEQLSSLVRNEARLAQAEVTQKAKKLGAGAGLFGGAGLTAFFGVAVLLSAAVLGLAELMPGWLAALIVAVVLFVVAGVLALVGKKDVAQASPPLPTQAIAGVQADVATVKQGLSR